MKWFIIFGVPREACLWTAPSEQEDIPWPYFKTVLKILEWLDSIEIRPVWRSRVSGWPRIPTGCN